MRRDIKSFEPTEEVAAMLRKARRGGVKLTWLCNEALRRYLTEQGYGINPKGKAENQ